MRWLPFRRNEREFCSLQVNKWHLSVFIVNLIAWWNALNRTLNLMAWHGLAWPGQWNAMHKQSLLKIKHQQFLPFYSCRMEQYANNYRSQATHFDWCACIGNAKIHKQNIPRQNTNDQRYGWYIIMHAVRMNEI